MVHSRESVLRKRQFTRDYRCWESLLWNAVGHYRWIDVPFTFDFNVVANLNKMDRPTPKSLSASCGNAFLHLREKRGICAAIRRHFLSEPDDFWPAAPFVSSAVRIVGFFFGPVFRRGVRFIMAQSTLTVFFENPFGSGAANVLTQSRPHRIQPCCYRFFMFLSLYRLPSGRKEKTPWADHSLCSKAGHGGIREGIVASFFHPPNLTKKARPLHGDSPAVDAKYGST